MTADIPYLGVRRRRQPLPAKTKTKTVNRSPQPTDPYARAWQDLIEARETAERERLKAIALHREMSSSDTAPGAIHRGGKHRAEVVPRPQVI